MKIKKLCAVLVIMVLAMCGGALADRITVVMGNGTVNTVDEFDTSYTGLTSGHNFGKAISSAAANPSNGNVVLGFADGTAAVVDFNHLGTAITSGSVGNGTNVLGTAIRPNGELCFANYDGWAYARSYTNVMAVPPGYTMPANVQFIPSHDPCLPAPHAYLYPTTSPLDTIVFRASDAKQTWIRKGNDMNSIPSGYVNTHMEWDGYITACRTLSTGDVVLAQMGPTGSSGARVFVRNDANMAASPTGYIGDGTTLGTGARSLALGVSKSDYVVVGNDSGQVFVRKASDLTQSVIPGFASTSTSDMDAYSGVQALTVTSNNNVVIALYDGKVYVRSLRDIDGADICPMTGRYAGCGDIVAVLVSKTETRTLTCADMIERGDVLTMDFNQDCYVDFQDFAMFALNWTKCNDPENKNCQ